MGKPKIIVLPLEDDSGGFSFWEKLLKETSGDIQFVPCKREARKFSRRP